MTNRTCVNSAKPAKRESVPKIKDTILSDKFLKSSPIYEYKMFRIKLTNFIPAVP